MSSLFIEVFSDREDTGGISPFCAAVALKEARKAFS
jgi:hypothetical protein